MLLLAKRVVVSLCPWVLPILLAASSGMVEAQGVPAGMPAPANALAACKCQGDEAVIARARLQTNLQILLAPELAPQSRVAMARYLQAQALYASSLLSQSRLLDMQEQVARGRADSVRTVLTGLRDEVLLTARLRAARGLLASMQATAPGQLQLVLKEVGADAALTEEVAAAILVSLERARQQGVDCDGISDFYLYKVQAPQALTIDESRIAHRDLKDLLKRRDTALNALTAGGPMPSTDDLVQLVKETREWQTRAYQVLGQSLGMYDSYLKRFPELERQRALAEEALRVALSRPSASPSPTDKAPATATSQGSSAAAALPTSPATDAENSAAASVTTTAPSGRESNGGNPGTGQPTPVSSSAPVETSPTAVVASLPSNSSTAPLGSSPDLSIPPSWNPQDNALEQAVMERKSAIVTEVNSQTAMLRRGAAGETGGMVQPLGLANNLLFRAKRIFQMADLLAVSQNDTEIYECTLSDDAVKIRYRTKKRELAWMEIEVRELFEDAVIMTWTITVERKNDTNFRLDSQFNGMLASLVVEEGRVVRYPNHQQLLVLMNRLAKITDTTVTLR